MPDKFTPADFGPFTLSAGSHTAPEDGMCVMEMTSFLAGEPWTDMPECSSPVVARFCQVLNDNFDQPDRDRLQTYVPRLIGTASPVHDIERAEYLAWQAIRVFTQISLDRAGLKAEAETLRSFDGNLKDAIAAARAASANDYAASAALYAADAAALAAYATLAAANIDIIFSTLDGLLDIGPSGENYQPTHIERANKLRAVMGVS